MPTVPSYGGQQVAPSSAPGGAFSAPDVRNAAPGQLQQAGEALSRAGAGVASIAMDMEQQVNQVRVDDALNKVRRQTLDLTYNPQTGYQTLKGDAALTRPEGKPLDQEYAGKLETTVSELSATLGNDAQRQAFMRQANDLTTSFRGSVQQYSTQQYQQHALSVQDGTIKIGADEAKLNWNDPDKIKGSIDSIQAAVYRSSTLQGWSASETTARIKATTSGVHMGVIDAALQNSNPEYAMAYVERNKAQMTADDLLKVRGVINKDLYARTADTIATGVMGQYRQQANPPESSRIRAITMQSESGGNPNATGPMVPGQGTAKGSMQVMDATNRNPGYGIKPAADDSKEERARVGGEYIDAMVQKYAGDMPKAWAAYNAGPGTVDKAVENARKNGTTWLSEMAALQSTANFKQTSDYVAKNMQALQDGGGAPAKPNLQEVHDGVRAQVAARYGPTPPAGVLKMALASATQLFEDNAKAIKSKEDQAVTEAMKALQQNGGRVSALPYAVRSQIPPDKLDNLISFGQKVAKGDDITNPAVYQRLSDPAYLKRLDENEFYHLRSELSLSDWQHFATQRAAAAGKGADKLGEINTGAVNSVLATRLQTLGIDPTPKDATDDAARVGAIKKFVTDSIIQQQRVTTKQMTDADVEKHIDSLFAKSASFRTSFLGIPTGSTQGRLLTMRASNIPTDIYDKLKTDFHANGIDPTDADLLGAYWKLQAIPKNKDTQQSKGGKIKSMEQAKLEADTREFLKGQ